MALNKTFSYSANGAEISEDGTFTCTSHGYGIDYEASTLYGTIIDKEVSGRETFRMSGGTISHNSSLFTGSNSVYTYIFTRK